MKEEREEPLLGERWHRVAMTERGSLSESIKTADPSQSPCGRQLPPRGAFHCILSTIQNLQSYELCGILDIEKDNRPQGGLPRKKSF